MGNIYYGPRQQVIADIAKLEGQILRSDVDMFSIWHTPTSPPKHIIWALESVKNIGSFKPRPDRHIALMDVDVLPKDVSKWASKNTTKISLKPAANPTREQLLSILVSGKIGIVFTQQAANLLLDLKPRGAQSLFWPLQQIKELEIPEPITADSLMGQWPIKHEVDAYNLYKSLGSLEAIKLADQVPEDKVWGGLDILSRICVNKPNYLDYLELVREQITDCNLRPKTSLSMFARLCYLHKQDQLDYDLISW